MTQNDKDIILKLAENVAAIARSPFRANFGNCELFRRHICHCRKPNPSYISSDWNEKFIRKDLMDTLEITKGMSAELVMKDVHALCGEPWRLGRCVEIARECIAKVYGM